MIDTQAIRNKILDLALRGKLTEQLPEDGTAEELFQQIQAEKETSKKPVKTKKVKPLQENEETIVPHEIPDNWVWVQFGELFSLTNGTASRGTAGGSAYPVLRLADLKNGEIDTNSIRKILLSDSEYRSHILKKGDMVFIRVNGSREKVAMPFCYYGEESISYCDHLFCAHCVSSLVFVPYVRLAFKISSTREQIEPKIKTTAGQNTINQDGLGSILIPLPPVSEQHRIVETIQKAFSSLDIIDALQAQYHDNLATLKSKLIDAGIQGKLTEQLPEDGTAEELYQQIQQEKQALEKAGKIKKSKPLPPVSDEEKLFDIPDNWKWVRMGNVMTLISGTDFRPEDYNDAGNGMPYMTGASNIENNKLIVNRWTSCPRNIAQEGDLLLVCKGSGFGKLVMCNVAEAHIARQFMSIRPYEGVDVHYIMSVMTNSFQKIKEAGKGLIPGVDRDTVLNISFPLPPLAEQKRIVAKLEELLPLCEG